MLVLSPPAHDGHVGEAEGLHHLAQPHDPPLHRLEEHDLEVRPHGGQHDPWEARARADVHDSAAAGKQRRHRGRVQQVPLPEDRNLPRSDETALHTRVGDQKAEGTDDVERIAQGLDRSGRRWVQPWSFRHGHDAARDGHIEVCFTWNTTACPQE